MTYHLVKNGMDDELDTPLTKDAKMVVEFQDPVETNGTQTINTIETDGYVAFRKQVNSSRSNINNNNTKTKWK